jgi:DNA replicative helicase MCM subunit Mcm2 (Cdc46/Mcm family)
MSEEAYKSSGSQPQTDTRSIDEAYEALYRKREIIDSIFTALKEHELLNNREEPFAPLWRYSGMPRHELLERLRKGYGVTKEEFNKIICELIRKGELYEPRPNFIKRC